MDPLATSILVSVIEKAGGAAYNALKAKLREKYGRNSDLVQAVESLERNPESEGRQAVVREEIVATRAFEDTELQLLAKQLLEALQSNPEWKAAVGSKYQIDARGASIGVIGDQANVEGGIHFGG